jgi:hypothetical protein
LGHNELSEETMSFEPLPQNLEEGVRRFAQQQRVSHDDAILMLIETALNGIPASMPTQSGKSAAEEMIGLFTSPEDRAVVDDVVAIAYEGRKAAAARDIAS